MNGLIVNLDDDRVGPDSPLRTRYEVRHGQRPIFVVDGMPVYEVWYWFAECGRWFVHSHGYNRELAASGVVFFDTIQQLKSILRRLGLRRA